MPARTDETTQSIPPHNRLYSQLSHHRRAAARNRRAATDIIRDERTVVTWRAGSICLGYVDQPASHRVDCVASRALRRQSLFVIRLLPALAIGLAVYLTSPSGAGTRRRPRSPMIVAADLDGNHAAGLGLGHLFTMNAFDYPFGWPLLWIILRIANTGNHRLWIAFGVLAGLTILNKYDASSSFS